jgi:hypothetical protein
MDLHVPGVLMYVFLHRHIASQAILKQQYKQRKQPKMLP